MFIRKGFWYVLMDQAGDGAGGGGGAVSAAGAAGAAAGSGADGGAGAGAAAGSAGSASGAGAGQGAAGSAAGAGDNALQAGAGEGGQQHFIPEKFQVKKEDGSIDLEASAQKLAETYGHLEKRMGTGDVPPKAAEEYQLAVPDALKDHWKPEEDELFLSFRKEAHEAGYTQKQFDFAMKKYFELAPQLVGGATQLSAEECTAQLKAEWKTDAEYKAGVGSAYKAAVAYFGSDAEAMIKEYGNDARFIRGLARMGAEMGEDKPLPPGGSLPDGQSIEAVMASEAYTNQKHPDHARVSKQVQEHFQRQASAAEKKNGAAIL